MSRSCFIARTSCSKTLTRSGGIATHFIRSSSLVLGGSAIITGTLYARLHWKSRVFCREKGWTRTVELESCDGDKEHRFPWKEFFKLMLPDIWHLLGAVLVWFGLSELHSALFFVCQFLLSVLSVQINYFIISFNVLNELYIYCYYSTVHVYFVIK